MVEACKEFKKEKSLRESCEKDILIISLYHKQDVNCVKVLSGLGVMPCQQEWYHGYIPVSIYLETGFFIYKYILY